MDTGTDRSARSLITVVIASVCDDARGHLLRRACDSVRAMAGALDYSIIVVANGARISSSVLTELRDRSDVTVLRVRTGSYPLARRIGAEFAFSEFLAFLDDDDELMPDTLRTKVDYFRRHPDVEVLVTDGFRMSGGAATRIFPPSEARSEDLVDTMMNAGWGAGALTLRSDRVDLSALNAEFRFMEWTLTALQLARRYRCGFIDEPMYRYYEDTPDSLSKRFEQRVAAPRVWQRLSEAYAGTSYEAKARRRYGRECHYVAVEYAQRWQLREAWAFHTRSLLAPGGLRNLPFLARLLFASLAYPFTRKGTGRNSEGDADPCANGAQADARNRGANSVN